jgi:hypothetical protein
MTALKSIIELELKRKGSGMVWNGSTIVIILGLRAYIVGGMDSIRSLRYVFGFMLK